MLRVLLLQLVFVLLLVSGCVESPPVTMTPLEIQSVQTREYEESKEVVFPSVVSVFQDLGYSITSADKYTGLIAAESAARSDAATQFWLGMTDVSQTKATGFVETIGNFTRIRLNFVEVRQTSSGYGQQDRQDTPILDAEIYQSAFEKIETAIFIRSN